MVGHSIEDGVEHRTSLGGRVDGTIRAGRAGAPVHLREGSAAPERAVVVGDHRRPCGFESWLERDHVMLLDFDAAVVGIASQPFPLFWCDGAGKEVLGVPDFFVRHADGWAVVIDCRPAERRPPAQPK